jgi:4-hydroxythreonine-4-phosphate dehydrogenase
MTNLIGITMGDPKGIGPEIVAKAWRSLSEDEKAQLVIYGDRAILSAVTELVGVEFNPKQLVITSTTKLPTTNISDSEAARIAMSALDAAVGDVKSGRIDAIVTAPINKKRIRRTQPGFIGHTEYLAKLTNTTDEIMMFCADEYIPSGEEQFPSKQLCISLVTTHLPLKEVPSKITEEKILNALRKTSEAMHNYFACPDARIAVMGLNPHCGENGLLGDEEINTILPAIEKARREGINCEGPYAADTMFSSLKDFDYDAVVAMYHDQGLLPIKLLCQSHCVNVTLGLPFIRTSPGHGTAEDKAWQGRADEKNLLATIHLTRKLLGWRI